MTNDEPYPFELSGGALCLDFANTVGDRPYSQNDHLQSYADLLSWARQADLVDRSRQISLAHEADSHPRVAARVFREAVDLRECIFHVFAALADGHRPAAADLARLNDSLAPVMGRLRLESDEEGIDWGWKGPATALDQMIWPVVRSAADLLTSEEGKSLRQCDSDTCSWLFVDRSRTRRRRWCDMKTCGNRAKARRHYERQKRRQRSGS